MMKLAEALIERADAQKRVEQLRARLTMNARIQEGETPAENPAELLGELAQVLENLTRLIRSINRTNGATAYNDEWTLTDALAERDRLMLERGVLATLAQNATMRMDRYSRSEVKYQSTVNVAELQKRIDELSKQYREMDATIQQKNWAVDLIEG